MLSKSINLILLFQIFTNSGAFSLDQTFLCESKHRIGGTRSGLKDWKVYGPNLNWICVGGDLQSQGLPSALRYANGSFKNGGIVLEIKKTLGVGNEGKGETVVWLRNGAVNKKMRRVRIVIEEQEDDSSITRIEELRETGGYEKLAVLKTPAYAGKYEIRLLGPKVDIIKGKLKASANTTVQNPGSVYLHDSIGEGKLTAYGAIRVYTDEI